MPGEEEIPGLRCASRVEQLADRIMQCDLPWRSRQRHLRHGDHPQHEQQYEGEGAADQHHRTDKASTSDQRYGADQQGEDRGADRGGTEQRQQRVRWVRPGRRCTALKIDGVRTGLTAAAAEVASNVHLIFVATRRRTKPQRSATGCRVSCWRWSAGGRVHAAPFMQLPELRATQWAGQNSTITPIVATRQWGHGSWPASDQQDPFIETVRWVTQELLRQGAEIARLADLHRADVAAPSRAPRPR